MLDVTSNTPFVALTLRSLNNSRVDFLLTRFPSQIRISVPPPRFFSLRWPMAVVL